MAREITFADALRAVTTSGRAPEHLINYGRKRHPFLVGYMRAKRRRTITVQAVTMTQAKRTAQAALEARFKDTDFSILTAAKVSADGA